MSHPKRRNASGLGAQVRALRQARGLPQWRLAMVLDVPQPRISYFERTGRLPKAVTVEQLAAALGTTPEVLSQTPAPLHTDHLTVEAGSVTVFHRPVVVQRPLATYADVR